MDIKDAMAQATVKLRANVDDATGIVLPNASQPITIDPVMSSYLGISDPDANMASQADTIQEFLKSQGADTPEKSLTAMKRLETSLGEGQPGTRLEKLYRYARLHLQSQSLRTQARAMEK